MPVHGQHDRRSARSAPYPEKERAGLANAEDEDLGGRPELDDTSKGVGAHLEECRIRRTWQIFTVRDVRDTK